MADIMSTNRKLSCRIRYEHDGNTYIIPKEWIVSARVTSRLVPGSVVSLGLAPDVQVEVVVDALLAHDVTGKKMILYFGLYDETKEDYTYYKKCYFYPEKPRKEKNKTYLNGLGSASKYLSGKYQTALTAENYNVRNILNEIAIDTGIVIDRNLEPFFTSPVSMYQNETFVFDGYTYGEVLGYIAQMNGMVCAEFISQEHDDIVFAMKSIFNSGVAQVVQLAYVYDGYEVSTEGTAISKLSCMTNGVALEVGNDDGGILQIENPAMTQSILENAYRRIPTTGYTTLNLELLGNYLIECGDTLIVSNGDETMFDTVVMYHEIYYDGGLKSTIASYKVGESDVSGETYRPPTADRIDKIEETLNAIIKGLNLYPKNGVVKSNGEPIIWHNGTNIWIGATSTAGEHHSGGTFISAGDESSVSVSKLINGTRTNVMMVDRQNLQAGKTEGITCNANAITEVPITFTRPFNSVPVVVVGLQSSSTGANIGQITVGVKNGSITTEGCTLSVWNGSSSGRTPILTWIAVGS